MRPLIIAISMIMLSLLPTVTMANPPVLLHQRSYPYEVQMVIEPQPTVELVRIAKDAWGFDGVVLSVDCLFAEFGTSEPSFKKRINELSNSLKGLELGEFQLRLDVDLKSDISKDLDKRDRELLAIHVTKQLPIISHNAYDECIIEHIPCEVGTTITVRTGKHWSKDTQKRDLALCNTRYQHSPFVVIVSSTPLRWTEREGGDIDCGSVPFKRCFETLLHKRGITHVRRSTRP